MRVCAQRGARRADQGGPTGRLRTPQGQGAAASGRLRKLVDAGLLQPTKPGARQYSIGFSHNMLLRGVVRALTDEGFIPAALAAPPA